MSSDSTSVVQVDEDTFTEWITLNDETVLTQAHWNDCTPDREPLPELYASPPVGCYRCIDGIEPDGVLYNESCEPEWPPNILGVASTHDEAHEPLTTESTSGPERDGVGQRHITRSSDNRISVDRSGTGGNQGFLSEPLVDKDTGPRDREGDSSITATPRTTVGNEEERNTQLEKRLHMHEDEMYPQEWYGDKICKQDRDRVKMRQDWEERTSIVKTIASQTLSEWPTAPWATDTIVDQYLTLDRSVGSTISRYKDEDITICLCALHMIDGVFHEPEAQQQAAYEYAQRCATDQLQTWNDDRPQPLQYGDVMTITDTIREQLDYVFTIPDEFSVREFWNPLSTVNTDDSIFINMVNNA
jgi:hypothetical protein